MLRSRLELVIGLGTGVILFCWPLLLPDSVGRMVAGKLSLGALFTLWAISAVFGVLLVLLLILSWLRKHHRAMAPGQPALGLAGKPWGPLAPSLWLPGAMALLVALLVFGWVSGFSSPFVLPAWFVVLAFGVVYIRGLWSARRRRDSFLHRTDMESASPTSNALLSQLDAQCALDTIAAALGVPKEKLRWSDRFGTDIGTFSSLDETLDRLGRILLSEQSKAGRPLTLENIKTIGDYITEWTCCNSGNATKC